MGVRKVMAVQCAAAVLLVLVAQGASAAGSITLLYGQKQLDKVDWELIDSQSEFGLALEVVDAGWPVAVVASYLKSDDSASFYDFDFGQMTLTGKTQELGIGARKYLSESRVRFYLEGGLATVAAEYAFNSAVISGSDSDAAFGVWLGAGVDMMMTDAWSFGISGRMTRADVTLYGIDGTAGGTHLNAFVSYHFQ